MTPEEARDRFAAAEVARLATADGTGRPHVVPVTFALDGERIVTAVDDKPKARRELRRVENIRANDRVSLLVDHYEADWRRLWWARADGRAHLIGPGPEAERAARLLRARYPQYAEVGIGGPIIVVAVERWLGWSATEG